MARKFGSKFSPGASRPSDAPLAPVSAPVVAKAGARTNLLFVPPILMAFLSFGSGAATLGLYLVAAGLMILAAWLTREGVLAQQVYDGRKVARRPVIPRKILGSLTMGGGLALASYIDTGLGGALATAAIGAGLHFAAFGPDPMKNKGMEGVDTYQADRVARVVEDGEARLKTMERTISRLRDRTLTSRVDLFTAQARRMFRTVEEDPRDLTAARKFIGVYLEGAKEATLKFVDLYGKKQDPEVRGAYETLLDDLQTNFAAKTEVLLADSRTDMDVEIKVLRDRLQREKLIEREY